MEQEVGRSAKRTGSRASHEADKPSSPKASIPNADTIAAMEACERGEETRFESVDALMEDAMRGNLLSGAVTCLIAAHSSLQWAHDNCAEDRIAAAIGRELLNIMQAKKLIRAASTIEARRAETGTGSVHESAPGRPETNGATHDQ